MLKGKTVFITGGSLGIGYAVAEHCARAGARLVLAARTGKDLAEAARKLKSIGPGEPLTRVLDVGDLGQVRAAADWAGKRLGGLDGLVNCAGVYGPIGRLDLIDMEEFDRAIRVNFLGTAFACHAFAPWMKDKSGAIVNFSGGGASAPFPNYSAYAAGKTAIVRLTENLAVEFAEIGIRVNVVAPGFVATRLHRDTLKAGGRAGAQFLENTKKQMESGGVPPEKAAKLTVFLLSEASAGITGKFISAPWDPWEDPACARKLREDKDYATLRRIDDMGFGKRRIGP
ncbi:MAG: hypothetical protein A2636_06125 [Elusimicrobia bacterium RIFCSPHIGHO2_01_FULL_64_10]|nr:MAG: hypothetical protein A2636_06125 [Elusimicrobia bacterium RIFCSPHIGHO2_01_FULL_64_10]